MFDFLIVKASLNVTNLMVDLEKQSRCEVFAAAFAFVA
jgi:hypothetical protein